MPAKNELYEAMLWLSGITHVSNGLLVCRKNENVLSYGLNGVWILAISASTGSVASKGALVNYY